MPTRGLRPSLARTHSRSSSAGSSKMVVNLQLTQKDPVQPKIDKARRTSHPHEVRHRSLAIIPTASSERCSQIFCPHQFPSFPLLLVFFFPGEIADRGTVQPNPRANVSRTGSTVHVQPREQVTGAQPRRATNPPPSRGGGRPRAGFTLATSTVGSDDEDEWVSSESGAATPLDDASGDEGSGKKTPQEVSPATPVDHVGQRVKGESPAAAATAAHVPGTTPRAELGQARPRVQTNGFAPTRPTHGAAAQAARISSSPEPSQYPQQEWESYRQQQQQPKRPRPQPADKAQAAPQKSLPHLSRQPPTPSSHIPDQSLPLKPPRTPDAVPGVTGVRTEPPTPTSPRSDHYHTHRVRPSSTRSFIADHALRPHPLIRGQSFGHGHLAPIKVSSDAAQAQLSSSPPSGRVSTSPTSIRTVNTVSQTSSPGRHFSNAIFRRPSTSSAHSAATLPVTPRTPIERGRTMSTLSTASSSAALSSLAHLPTRGSAAASQNAPLAVYFPPQDPHSHPETVHVLLPPPYVTPHFTVLQWRSPICESHDKVGRARESQRRRPRT